MAEALTELEKLQKAAKLIEEMSQGRLQVCPSVVGQVYIRPQNEAYLGLAKRINFVLSNTLQMLSYDGRFSPSNREWARRTYIPSDADHNTSYRVKSHPAILDGFVRMMRDAYQSLGLFGPQHCEPYSFESLDYEGKVLVLSLDTLQESCWSPENQLWYGFQLIDFTDQPEQSQDMSMTL